MKDIDEAMELSLSLVKAVVAEMRSSYPEWVRAFLRIQAEDDWIECKASYVLPDGVQILDVMKHEEFTNNCVELGTKLREVITSRKKFCVFLLSVGADLDYEFHYEHENPNRWRITKMGGGSGLPEGFNAA